MDKLNFMFDAKQFAAAFAPIAADSSPASSQAVAVAWLEGSTGVARAGADAATDAATAANRAVRGVRVSLAPRAA
jgi:hypothetical protein